MRFSILALYTPPFYWRNNPAFEQARMSTMLVAVPLAVMAGLLYWWLVAWWVLLDVRQKGNRGAVLWALFALLTNVMGLVVYLLITSSQTRACKQCGHPLPEGFRLCPYCGPTSYVTCIHCGMMVQSDWKWCPVCEGALPALGAADTTPRTGPEISRRPSQPSSGEIKLPPT